MCAPCDWLAGAEWTRGARSQPRIQPHEMKRVRDELQDPPAIDATTDEESHFESDEDDDNDSRTGGPRLTVFPASHTWERTPAMREMKRRHQDALDDLHDGDREAHIFGTTLKGRDIVLCVPRLPSRAPSTPPRPTPCFSQPTCPAPLLLPQRGEPLPVRVRRRHRALDALEPT